MSTEPAAPAGRGRAATRRARGFRLRLVAVVGALALAAVALTAVGALQGPRLRSSSIDASAAIERGERLVLRADQVLAPLADDAVTVEPAAAATATVDGATVTVRFAAPLRDAADYRVSVRAAGAATGREATLAAAFRTPSQRMATLLRDPDGPDEVRVTDLGTGEVTTVLEAPRIQEYALLGDSVAAVLLDEADAPSIVVQRIGDPLPQTITVPTAGSVHGLRVSPTSGLLGFVVAESDGLDTLYTVDPLSSSGYPQPVLDADGASFDVRDWSWVPGTGSLVVQATDQGCWLVDVLRGGAPAPLGQHAELRGWVPGTTTLVVADPDRGSTIDLATGEAQTLDLAPDGAGPDAYPAAVLLRDADHDYVELVAEPDDASPVGLGFRVIAVGPHAPRTVYEPATAGAPIRRICLSPNGEHVAVELGAADAEPDGYPAAPSFFGTTTYVVDLETGDASRGALGIAASWCF